MAHYQAGASWPMSHVSSSAVHAYVRALPSPHAIIATSVTSRGQRHCHKPHTDGGSDASCRQVAARSSCGVGGGAILAPVVTSTQAWHWCRHNSHTGAGVIESTCLQSCLRGAHARGLFLCAHACMATCVHAPLRCLLLPFPPGRQMKKVGDPCDTEFAVSIFNNFTVRICCQILKRWQI